MNSDPLDTEIRRAMGELANAAPPARPAESFTTNSLTTELEPLRTSSGSSASGSPGRRNWLLAAAASVVVAIVGVAVVVANSDDSPTSISGQPTTPTATTAPDVGPLTGDALIDELADRRWVALERFDDPSPTARTPEFRVTAATGGAIVEGFDGCNTYRGPFDGDELVSTTVGCDVETLGFTNSIELLPGASTLLIVDADGTPLARFHDLAELEPASADDVPYTFFVDDLEAVTFVVSGVGFAQCTRVGWEENGGGVSIELLERDTCDPALIRGPASGWLADVAENGAEVFVASDGIVLADDSSTLHLRRLPVVEPDPDGITLAAGAAFGFEPGLGTGPDEVLDVLGPRFGQPDFDSGRLPPERMVDDEGNVTVLSPCGDRAEYRELWWGDLSFGFWVDGSRTYLHFWKVGDPRITASQVPEVEVGPITPSGLTTEDGVGVGDPAASIPDRFNVSDAEGFFGFDPSGDPAVVSVLSANPAFTPGSVVSPTVGGLYVVVDGEVIGFGAESFDSC